MTEYRRLVMFDCDGTLVDSQHAIVAGVAAACEALGLKMPSAEAIKRGVGLPLGVGIGRLFPGHGPELQDRITQFYKENFFRLRQRPEHAEPLFPGIIETLDALRDAGCLLGVATGKSRRGLIATLERHGLAQRFDVLQTADDAPGKPNPGMLLNAMSALAVAPSDTVMIGDTTFDIDMARAARVTAIGVAWGYHEIDELVAAGAASIVPDGAALAPVVLRWVGRTAP